MYESPSLVLDLIKDDVTYHLLFVLEYHILDFVILLYCTIFTQKKTMNQKLLLSHKFILYFFFFFLFSK
jgi:hypothetical protein